MDNDNQLPPAPVAEELSGKPVPGVCINEDGRPALVGDGCENLMGRKPLYAHPQPAIDVDALAEMLWGNEKLDSALRMRRQAKNLAIDISNWIEEQQSE